VVVFVFDGVHGKFQVNEFRIFGIQNDLIERTTLTVQILRHAEWNRSTFVSATNHLVDVPVGAKEGEVNHTHIT
jgi:hypothetical protein